MQLGFYLEEGKEEDLPPGRSDDCGEEESGSVIIAKNFPLSLFLSLLSLFLFLTSIFLPFEGRRIIERKEKDKRKEKKEREKRNYFARSHLTLIWKYLENLTRLRFEIYCGKKWRDGIRSSVRGSTVPGAFTRGNRTKDRIHAFCFA